MMVMVLPFVWLSCCVLLLLLLPPLLPPSPSSLPPPTPLLQVDLSREAANLKRFNNNFKRAKAVSSTG